MTLKGKLIEYIDHGKFFCAFVCEEAGKRLHLLNQNGREVSLPSARVVHQSLKAYPVNVPREDLLAHLKTAAASRDSMTFPVDLEEIWELISESPDSLFDASFLAELCFGEDVSDDQVASFVRRVFADRLFFKFKEGKIVAHPPEVVEQLRIREEKERRKEELLQAGAEGMVRLWEGDGPVDWPNSVTCLHLVEEYYLHGNDAPESGVARELLKRAGLTRPHDAFYFLVKAGVWDKNENLPLRRYDVPTAFPEEVLAEAESLQEPDVDTLLSEGRRDLRDLPILTIDGEATRDFDDALHVERRGDNFLVGIHIADAAHYVRPGSALFDEAARRMTSIYFPNDRVSMIPELLSEGLCSLIAGKDRAALSFMVLLSPDGEVLDSDMVPSVVRIKRQLSYTESEKLLDTDEELRALAMLSEKLRQRRIDNGALLLPIPEVNIQIDPDGDAVSIIIADPDTRPRVLVAEFMVLANWLGAAYVAEREVPGLFRSQKPPRQRLAQTPQKDLYFNYRQRRYLQRGKLSTSAEPHSGVGVMQYTTITSPIRRFLDLVMQHQIKSLARGKGALFPKHELNEIAGSILTAQSKVNLVRQLRHRYWILKYLERSVGSRVDVLILEKGPRRVKGLVLDCLLETDLPANRGVVAKPGDTVSVAISRVSVLDNLVRFEW